VRTIRSRELATDPQVNLKLYALGHNEEEPPGSIGIPVRDHLNAATATALQTTAIAGAILRRLDFNMVQGGILTMQRNLLVQRMRGDWLLFIDDDMVWQPDDLARLIATRDEFDFDMLGALCFRRAAPFQPTLYMREEPDAGAYNFLEKWEEDIIEVDGTGMAFIVIHKRVFERMVALYEEKPGWRMPPFAERLTQSPPNFFRWEGQLGEDLRFCQEAKRAGARIFVDTRIPIGHIGEVELGYRDFLKEIADRDPELEAARREVNERMGLPTMTREEALGRLGWT